MAKKDVLKHIAKLRRSRTKIYREDAEDMQDVLDELRKRKYKEARRIFWNMDTVVRDDFTRLYTDNYKNKRIVRELGKKLKIHWNF